MNPVWHNLVAITRLNRPVGILLLAWPVAWALWLATEGRPDIRLIALFAAGVIIMRSAGCIINDILDRKFDAKVERTAHRPLAQGSMSLRQAWLTLAGLMVMAGCLWLLLNPSSQLLAVVAAIMTLLYPLCKRVTHAPQLFLGLTFNMGVLMVYTEVQGSIPLQGWLLYAAAMSWTLAYDTIYALQDVNDDMKIGLKSTALLFGKYHLIFIAGFYALTYWLFQRAATLNIMGYLAGVLMVWALIQTLNKAYGRAFYTNMLIGAALFFSLVYGIA